METLATLQTTLLDQQNTVNQAQVEDIFTQLQTEHAENQAEFWRIETDLNNLAFPDKILQRHHTTVTQYRRKIEPLLKLLSTWIETQDSAVYQRIVTQLATLLDTSTPQWQEAQARTRTVTREPFNTVESLEKVFPTIQRTRSPLSTLQNLNDLAAHEEIQLTPEIQVLAQELDNSSVAIYFWVRNHIDFVPSYGAIQGAAQTLKSQRGNAFDTASLLIAL